MFHGRQIDEEKQICLKKKTNQVVSGVVDAAVGQGGADGRAGGAAARDGGAARQCETLTLGFLIF